MTVGLMIKEKLGYHLSDIDVILAKEYDSFKKNEEIVAKSIDNSDFFGIMEEYGFPYSRISRIVDGGVYSFDEQQEFNLTLQSIHKDRGISIIDCIVFIEDSIVLTKIMRVLDGDTKYMLKIALGEKFNINVPKSNIYDIIS